MELCKVGRGGLSPPPPSVMLTEIKIAVESAT